ncbi:MAG: hypothetical protein K8S18_07295 [Desulfobacula sp.]|nr:hypothetical protein [Desulfobacula sp.]
MTRKTVPIALKRWFVIHFAVDVLFAIPLFFFPVAFLTLLGWHSIDPFATRIVAAALFGIGIESFLGRNATAQTFKNMLNLKIIWSGATIAGVGLSILQNTYPTAIAQWLLLGTFIAFHILWVFWRIRIGRMLI